jgi:hypothetical protein
VPGKREQNARQATGRPRRCCVSRNQIGGIDSSARSAAGYRARIMLRFNDKLKQSVVLNSQVFIGATEYIPARCQGTFSVQGPLSAMSYEHSSKYTPRSPRCPSCARIMPLVRASRFKDLYINYIFECRPCGMSRTDAVEIETT